MQNPKNRRRCTKTLGAPYQLMPEYLGDFVAQLGILITGSKKPKEPPRWAALLFLKGKAG
jgi:hypothetical protein